MSALCQRWNALIIHFMNIAQPFLQAPGTAGAGLLCLSAATDPAT
jgi:hypothetical protein